MGQPFEAAKDYKGRWGVFDTTSYVWHYPPKGERQGRVWAVNLARTLNEHMRQHQEKTGDNDEH